MPSNSSIQFAPEQFDRLFQELYRIYKADMFLSRSEFPGGGDCYIGLEPCHQLIVTDKTTKEQIESFCFNDTDPTFGYLSYNYGYRLRGVLSNKITEFPYGHLKKYSAVIKYDGKSLELSVFDETFDIDLDKIISLTEAKTPFEIGHIKPAESINSSLDRDEYILRTESAIDYIREGYIYQLNLTIKYECDFQASDLFPLYASFWKTFPASHYVLFESEPYQIISTSPESFLSVIDGKVLSQPIKGTLAYDTYDESLAVKLKESPKESAELSMIVDMVRNDISINCEHGSVKVSDHKTTFTVDNLIQMYSKVQGKLRRDKTVIDLMLDSFPGASITGCPKKKAMELIDELEPHFRDVYCGSFFVINDKRNMESSIAIRTGYLDKDKGRLAFFAGSGIVVESKAESEYLETTAKAGKFLDILKSEQKP
ncbi:MAG: chorismate-binding protein [candidate division Zixibacteria bacterium]|nr:chorismate-binding protein [candidate division Zixibacteria bacterium]